VRWVPNTNFEDGRSLRLRCLMSIQRIDNLEAEVTSPIRHDQVLYLIFLRATIGAIASNKSSRFSRENSKTGRFRPCFYMA